NVTGIISNTHAIARLLHEYDALSFWDFAASSPYVAIDMEGEHDGISYKDAIFFSPHKLIGGPGTPGVLVARRELFSNTVPAVVGGGTVSYVSTEDHHYLDDIEHREEGGTPAIVESIRAGLVFLLKERVGPDSIRELEDDFIRRAINRWLEHPNIEVLGNPRADRLSIVSFIIKFRDRSLHHNYVVAVLNDVFGIQARGGCSCAGPYGHTLLGIDAETSHRFEDEVMHGCEGIKPGWVRVNFNYFISETVFDFVVSAVEMVADRGWTLLPFYNFDPHSGLWRHHDGMATPPLSLHDITFDGGRLSYPDKRHTAPEEDLGRYLHEAQQIFDAAEADHPVGAHIDLGPGFEALRWFPIPEEL
ncbi:MAG: aminotransferase class V-fold PLP-dependent enzyme, partial [Acidimicrobiia bacterium]|nr:aminotransferase class V-fold PLP-dependent enzyme [Acidimicrobiia bacterium]